MVPVLLAVVDTVLHHMVHSVDDAGAFDPVIYHLILLYQIHTDDSDGVEIQMRCPSCDPPVICFGDLA